MGRVFFMDEFRNEQEFPEKIGGNEVLARQIWIGSEEWKSRTSNKYWFEVLLIWGERKRTEWTRRLIERNSVSFMCIVPTPMLNGHNENFISSSVTFYVVPMYLPSVHHEEEHWEQPVEHSNYWKETEGENIAMLIAMTASAPANVRTSSHTTTPCYRGSFKPAKMGHSSLVSCDDGQRHQMRVLRSTSVHWQRNRGADWQAPWVSEWVTVRYIEMDQDSSMKELTLTFNWSDLGHRALPVSPLLVEPRPLENLLKVSTCRLLAWPNNFCLCPVNLQSLPWLVRVQKALTGSKKLEPQLHGKIRGQTTFAN